MSTAIASYSHIASYKADLENGIIAESAARVAVGSEWKTWNMIQKVVFPQVLHLVLACFTLYNYIESR